ncbi:hypothetical protein NSB25_27210 [Acetatifactor muris]|uniref:Uncharacterized protein n=1 Tax=Acetatifactor muris TaxID=879566 RepID=A0A2K4ZPT1_9FIRM|nr:hypothetical protein [Acetatifactor muris]MCR2050914.1 hypothetical protein [Acetatifactor muris]SOY32503.1 hypothetical protein AMURIS_05268 [Acetatifactor muris]
MTKLEYGKCVKLMEEAIRNAKQSSEEYKAYNQLLNVDTIKAETEQRKADQHYGYAEGINQVLATLGFKHDRMKELSELL